MQSTWLRSGLILLIFALLSSTALGRGGGGCFLPDTLISTPHGAKAISELSEGDEIISLNGDKETVGIVAAIYRTDEPGYYEISVPGSSVNVTGDHLFYTDRGVLKRAKDLKAGDSVAVYGSGGLVYEAIHSVNVHDTPTGVYNLLVNGRNNFLANSFLVHNKGCFLPDTPVLTSDGTWKNISDVKAGDSIAAYTYDGVVVNATVEEIFSLESDGYYELDTNGGYVLKVTGEHPFYAGNGTFKTVDYLNPGDGVYVYDGTGLSDEWIKSKRWIAEKTTVYNLRTDWPNTYFANRVAVHNKGCFLPDTMIDTPDGRQKIGTIKAGDVVYGFDGENSIVKTGVLEVIELNQSSYYEIETSNHAVNATAEHPFYSVNGSFITAKDLRVGDQVYVLGDKGLKPETVTHTKSVDRDVKVINLHVNEPNTFFANGFAVHNKGGCFTAGTMISSPSGETSIESINIGDTVYSVTSQGSLQPSRVEDIYKTTSRILRIRTGRREVNTTAEHPFMSADGSFRYAGELKTGDKVAVYDGVNQTTEEITSIDETGETIVYNLDVGTPHTFIANGFIVHNKGGSVGGGSSGSSSPYTSSTYCGTTVNQTFSGGRMIEGQQCIYVYYNLTKSASALDSCVTQATDPWDTCYSQTGFAITKELRFKCKYDEQCKNITELQLTEGGKVKIIKPTGLFETVIIIVIFGIFSLLSFAPFAVIFIVIIILASKKKTMTDENLDYCFPRSQVDQRGAKTAKVLEYLGKQDNIWEPVQLKDYVKDVFLKLQKCWEARDYGEMEPLLMPYLYKQHLEQINSLIRNHEIDKIENVNVNYVEIIQLRHYAKKNMQEFTAIIEASAKDYYVDDRNGNFLRGDSSPATFQEFWVFQRQEDKWLLREIDQTRECNALREENFVEELTPYQLQNVYGESSKPTASESAPWLEEDTAKKAGRIHRMLNFLANTDRGWDEENMKEIVRKTFISVLTAFENRDASGLKDLVTDEALQEYSTNVQEMIDSDRSVEYRNMCVRKVDIVLVKNYTDENRDEFTARVSAHAQTIRKEGDRVISGEEYVTPFERYLTFRKQAGAWKLLKIQPQADIRSILGEENVDEESSKEQIEWYYAQDRAV